MHVGLFCFFPTNPHFLPPNLPIFKPCLVCLVSVSIMEKKNSSQPSHDLEQMYKHPSFNYTWSYKKKKIIIVMDTLQVVYAGILLSKNGSFKKKKKKKKKNPKLYYRNW